MPADTAGRGVSLSGDCNSDTLKPSALLVLQGDTTPPAYVAVSAVIKRYELRTARQMTCTVQWPMVFKQPLPRAGWLTDLSCHAGSPPPPALLNEHHNGRLTCTTHIATTAEGLKQTMFPLLIAMVCGELVVSRLRAADSTVIHRWRRRATVRC
jgi:hypothetical protein